MVKGFVFLQSIGEMYHLLRLVRPQLVYLNILSFDTVFGNEKINKPYFIQMKISQTKVNV